jgi:hypothetical protein
MTSLPSPFSSREPVPFDDVLIELYLERGRSVDDLAYTPDFEFIYSRLVEKGDTRTRSEVFRRLLTLRKTGRLPRVA